MGEDLVIEGSVSEEKEFELNLLRDKEAVELFRTGVMRSREQVSGRALMYSRILRTLEDVP